MKRFVSAVLIIVVLASCSKGDLVTPEQQEESMAATGDLFYKDANVAIANVQAVASGENVTFHFTSLYEKNVEKVEVMSGPYENMLCFFYARALPTTSMSAKKYTVTEEDAASGVRFYVIKYTLRSGAWVLTPAFRYEK